MRRRTQLAQAAAEATARAQRAADTRCGLCERAVQQTSRHHLVPREEGGRYGDVVDLCQPCHSSVHRFLTNKELARHYSTVEALRGAEELRGYLSWIRKNKVEKISNRRGRG
ncbi:MAG TPA: HNH endonuclease [Hymenobacter sp.]|uniref:HNH endonuclease n=1 Tax=Hymenobacter sp. TaxID=1898978 RepID=UPI002D7EE2A0|nr:HNH endonuclease [Hymenobacter sp.]HET9503548.1 HNH endonuclease [Hymenobacter sp.]